MQLVDLSIARAPVLPTGTSNKAKVRRHGREPGAQLPTKIWLVFPEVLVKHEFSR
jgi:hypothetical protein